MSVTEIKAEIEKLTPEEKRELHDALQAALAALQKTPTAMSEYIGSMRDTAVLKPGWDEDEPPEDWEALRDDSPS